MNRLFAMENKIKNLSFENKLSSQATESYHLKILIPNDVVGSIIGKKGSII